MNTFGKTKSTINPRGILGGIMGSFEEDYEKETSAASAVSSVASGFFESILSLGKDIAGVEEKTESNNANKFPSKGSIEFNQAVKKEVDEQQKKKADIDRKQAFFQALKEEQSRAGRATDKLLFEEEINDIATNLPTEEKNRLLHYQASYKDRSIYQRAELRRKIIEQQKQAEEKQKEASLPSPAKQPSAMEGAFEGRSGTQGGGSANLSAQAVG